MSDTEQEVNENTTEQLLEKIQEKQMNTFATILQTSLAEFTTSLGQMLTNKRSAEVGQEEGTRKRARTYVERPEDQPSCSKTLDRFVEVPSQNESDDEGTSDTRAYAESVNDDIVSIPDQNQVCDDVAELLQPRLDEDKNDNVDLQQQEAILNDIRQNFKEKQEEGPPLNNEILAETLNQFFGDPLNEEKLKNMMKEYSRPSNCNYAKAQLCNPEIWRLNLASLQRSTDIMLQKVLLHVVKASYALMISCDKLIVKGEDCKDILAQVVDSLALLGTSSIEINQLRRDLMRHKLPNNLKPLAKDVPPGSDFLFGDDINKRISQLSSTNSALQKSDNRSYTGYSGSNHHNNKYNQKHNGKQKCYKSKNYQAPHRSSGHGNKGFRQSNNYKKRN